MELTVSGWKHIVERLLYYPAHDRLRHEINQQIRGRNPESSIKITFRRQDDPYLIEDLMGMLPPQQRITELERALQKFALFGQAYALEFNGNPMMLQPSKAVYGIGLSNQVCDALQMPENSSLEITVEDLLNAARVIGGKVG